MFIAKRVLTTCIVVFFSIGVAQAEEFEFLDFDWGNLYAGGGLSYNMLSTLRGRSYDNAVGAQAFFGWDFFQFREFTVAGEAGALYSGDFDYSETLAGDTLRDKRSFSGPYVTAVGRYPLTDMIWVQARLGVNGIGKGVGREVAGGGIGLRITPTVSVRAEAVTYGFDIHSIQAAAVVTF